MKITVFTPTYNRGYTLSDLYHSLQCQTSKDFEWLIIDDGSTDNTRDLVEKWIKDDNKFLIRYYKQKNSGKCKAINKALDLAKGKLFLVIDSDDHLTCDAIEKVITWESELPDDALYCGVSGNLGTTEKDTSNRVFENGFYEGSLLDRYINVDGERAFAFYTEIHRKYKYPLFKNEKFMTEAVAWNRMANDGYKMRFYNDIICVYQYREDGLTKAGNSLFLNNPKGYTLWLTELARFNGEKSVFKKLKLLYSLCVELCPLYDSKKVADCLKTNRFVVKLLFGVYKIKHLRE